MFDQVCDEAQQDVERGAVASVDNVVESVTSAREGFKDNPRHLLVLVQREAQGSAYSEQATTLSEDYSLLDFRLPLVIRTCQRG